MKDRLIDRVSPGDLLEAVGDKGDLDARKVLRGEGLSERERRVEAAVRESLSEAEPVSGAMDQRWRILDGTEPEATRSAMSAS
jgi:hypothetical protein